MVLKASLHIHTVEDKVEGYIIRYNVYELIDWAAQLGFKVLGLTCHKNFVYRKEFIDYAEAKGVMLLFGVELYMKKRIKRNDLIVLNIKPEEAEKIEKISSFAKLAEYKRKHPEIFILAPHPLADRRFSMGKRKLVRHIDLFDAVEHCWTYSRLINPNRKAKKISRRFNKPFVATSDTHSLKFFNTDYILVQADKLNPASFFTALKAGNFTNVTRPKKLLELVWFAINFQFKKIVFIVIQKRRQHKVFYKF